MYEFYITPTEYEMAEKNGISKQCLEVRIRSLGWSKARALNEKPLKFNRLPKEWIDIARKNGICYSTFKYRVNILKLDIEIAATKPPMTNREIGLLTKDKRSNFIYGNKYRAITE